MNTLNRFLNYINISTNSNPNSNSTPSSNGQKILAKWLVNELSLMGVKNIFYDEEHCYVYAHLKGENTLSSIGFIAHLDTSPDVNDLNIKPNILKNYDGKDINLSDGIILSTADYPDLLSMIGKTLITTNGKTLLGADDKAGITAIMNMLEYFCNNNQKHADIYVCFTPDEEIGDGTKYFDFDKFKADYAYTVDGSYVGEISFENFNAASVQINIKGVNSHCGTAKGSMINSLLIANEINNLLPNETPSNTEGYEGFYHLEKISGNVGETNMRYLIRDFDKDNFEKRKERFVKITNELNKKYNNCIDIKISDTYYNMYDILKDNFHLIDIAKKAAENVGITPKITPIRGGTDGADLTYSGLPCPNLGTGGHNYHSIYEYVSVEDMEKQSEILIDIVKQYSKKK